MFIPWVPQGTLAGIYGRHRGKNIGTESEQLTAESETTKLCKRDTRGKILNSVKTAYYKSWDASGQKTQMDRTSTEGVIKRKRIVKRRKYEVLVLWTWRWGGGCCIAVQCGDNHRLNLWLLLIIFASFTFPPRNHFIMLQRFSAIVARGGA